MNNFDLDLYWGEVRGIVVSLMVAKYAYFYTHKQSHEALAANGYKLYNVATHFSGISDLETTPNWFDSQLEFIKSMTNPELGLYLQLLSNQDNLTREIGETDIFRNLVEKFLLHCICCKISSIEKKRINDNNFCHLAEMLTWFSCPFFVVNREYFELYVNAIKKSNDEISGFTKNANIMLGAIRYKF